MSSRILRPDQALQAEPLAWRSIGGAPPPEDPESPPPGPTETKQEPVFNGPTWEEFRALELQLRQLEQQLPIREQAARQAGFKEGEAVGNARWNEAIERAARSVADFAALRGRLRREAEQDVVKLSMAIARRVLRRELTVDPEALSGLIKTAFGRLDVRELHRVRVRPDDSATVSAHLARIGAPEKIEVLADAGLERGGLLFETDKGELDVSLDTQLEEIERGFVDLLARRRE